MAGTTRENRPVSRWRRSRRRIVPLDTADSATRAAPDATAPRHLATLSAPVRGAKECPRQSWTRDRVEHLERAIGLAGTPRPLQIQSRARAMLWLASAYLQESTASSESARRGRVRDEQATR